MCIVRIYILILTVPNGFLGLLTLTIPQHDLFCFRSLFSDSVSTMNQFINFDRLEQSRIQLAFDITDVFPILSNMYIFKLNLADSVIALAFFFWSSESDSRKKDNGLQSDPWFRTGLHDVFRREAELPFCQWAPILDSAVNYTMCSEEMLGE